VAWIAVFEGFDAPPTADGGKVKDDASKQPLRARIARRAPRCVVGALPRAGIDRGPNR